MWTVAEAMAAIANAFATTLLLWGERRRLPMQNVAALGLLAVALGAGFEWGMARACGMGSLGWIPRAAGWPVAWLGSRALARGVTAPGGPLAVRTLAFGTLLLPGVGEVAWRMAEPGGQGVGLAAARLVWMLLGFLALAPWWIRKPLSAPRAALPLVEATAILATVVQANLVPGLLSARGWAHAVALAGPLAAAAWLWARRRRPTGWMGRNGRMS